LAVHMALYSSFPFLARFGFAVTAGLFIHLCFTHVAHDVCHSSFSSNSSIWYYLGLSGDILLGHSSLMWTYRHNFGHHINTNTPYEDPDISYYLKASQDTIFYKTPLKLQIPLFLKPFLHSLASILMKIEDVVSFVQGRFGLVKINKPSLFAVVHFWASKLWFIFYRIILPILVTQRIIETLIIFFTIEMVNGFFFGLFTQVNHINTASAFQDAQTEKDWAMTQITTSIDYGHDSVFWTYLSGNLNYQVPHHLFPTINPELYPAVSLIVKQMCQDYGVKYTIKKNFIHAAIDHFEQLDAIAKDI